MKSFIEIEHDNELQSLPPFSLTIEPKQVCAIYSDPNLHKDLLRVIANDQKQIVWQDNETLYENLTIEDNLKFFHKWFDCAVSLPEIIVQFKLTDILKKRVKKCTTSEYRRLRFAKYFMLNVHTPIFIEPIHSVDDSTIHTFITMVESFKNANKPVLIIVSYLEHALLLANKTFHLKKSDWKQIEVKESEIEEDMNRFDRPVIDSVFKIQAKHGDKLVLFDPTEIDYIESRDGKSMIMIEDEEFLLDATLTEVEKKLTMYGFFRCHRSYLVNLQKVREIITWSRNTYSLRLNNRKKSTVPLSRAKVKQIQEIFSSP